MSPSLPTPAPSPRPFQGDKNHIEERGTGAAGTAQPAPSLVSVIDGWLVDTETGECLGPVLPEPKWVPDTQEKVEWVLEKMLGLDSDLAALEARKSALIENMDAMIREKRGRRNSLDFCFGRDVVEFARLNLPEGKKTWRCPFGSVAFRVVPAHVKVSDPEMAVASLKALCPEAVRATESVLVKSISPTLYGRLFDEPELAPSIGLEAVPERESVTVKTGVQG